MNSNRWLGLAALVASIGTLRCGPAASLPPEEEMSGTSAYGTGGYPAAPGTYPGAPAAPGALPGVPPPSGLPTSGGAPAVAGPGPTSPGATDQPLAAPAGEPTAGPGIVGSDPIGNLNRAPGFVDLSPPMGAPLDGVGTPLNPPAPIGWTWYAIEGAVCRDGSPTGFFVHQGTADKLAIYLEGGGACSNDHFCAFNPMSANHLLTGDGSNVLGSAAGAAPGRQQPGIYTDPTHTAAPSGLFDFANPQNPFKDWSQVYVPYCTGDVHYGMKPNAVVPNLPPQQFVGGINMRLFISRIVPTFQGEVSQVILTGPSAGGFGAALNYSMVQDAFGDTPVSALDDSGPPFDDAFMPVCMQKRWRETWGFELPPDCAECRQEDGGGFVRLADFLLRKHPRGTLGIISSMQDEVIRLFYSVGMKDCAGYDVADPVAITLGQLDPTVYFPAQQYTDGLNDLRTKYVSTGRLATYYMPGLLHQHTFRPSFYTPNAAGVTPAQWVASFLDGDMQQVGP